MTESELVQATVSWITLTYTASQWWLTVTTALILATYFAGRYIPSWLFAIVMSLYFLSAMSAIFEVRLYSSLAESYGNRLGQIGSTGRAAAPDARTGWGFADFNSFVNYSVFILGTFSAAAFSFLRWRGVRAPATKVAPEPDTPG